MNINNLFEKQRQLDEYIKREKGLEQVDTLNKIMALSVELGECANEFPTIFKYWSSKKNNHSRGLIEFVDMLHFALSIANDMGYTKHQYTKTVPKDLRLTYLGLQNILAILAVDPSKRHLDALFNHLITFGYQLDFTESDVINAYETKHAENYKRQKIGY